MPAFSEACERNKEPILGILRGAFAGQQPDQYRVAVQPLVLLEHPQIHSLGRLH